MKWLTHHSTGPAQKAAQAGEFIRLATAKTTMNITIREARITDIPAVAEMFDLYRQFYEQKPDPPLAKQFIADRLSNHESVILVAESASSGMLGFCQLYPSFCSVEAKPIYSLYDLYVLPVARKSGVGP